MVIGDIEEGQLIAIELDQNHLCLKLGVVSAVGAKCRVLAFNTTGTPISVEFGAFAYRAGLTTVESAPTFGEIEGAKIQNGVLTLEGDFGDMVVFADTISIESLPA